MNNLISVIVPLYNRMDIFPKTLGALFSQNIPRSQYEVIVVDDASIDFAEQYIASVASNYPTLTYIRHDNNKGLSAARNSGIERVNGGVIIFLDADMVVDENFLSLHMSAHARSHDEDLAVVSNVIYPDECIGNSNFARFIQSLELGSRSISERKSINYDDLPSRCFAGGASSVRSDIVKKIGGFDTKFKMYGGEDEEFGWRLKRAGTRITVCEEAIAYHHDNMSMDRYKNKLIETGRGSYKIIINSNVDQFEGSKVNHLLPIDLSKDSFKVIAKKIVLKMVISTIVTTVLEFYAKTTDEYPVFYSHTLYRLLCAGWLARALRMAPIDRSIVW